MTPREIVHANCNMDKVALMFNGIAMFRAGCNSSHEFYLGHKDGKLFLYTDGDTYINDEGLGEYARELGNDPHWQYQLSEHSFHEITDLSRIPYLGNRN